MIVEGVHHSDDSVELPWKPQRGAVSVNVTPLGDGRYEVSPVHRVCCPRHGDRAMSLDGPEPMCEDCCVVGPDGLPLGWQDGMPT